MLRELLPAFIGAFVRWVLTFVSGAGVMVAPTTEMQLTSGLVAVVMLGWSWYQKHKMKAGSAPPLLGIMVAASLSIAIALSACAGGAQTQNECMRKVAAVELAVSGGVKTTVQLVAAGAIDKPTGRKAMAALKTANIAADNALPLCSLEDPKASDFLLQAATALAQFTTLTGVKP